MSCCLLRSTDWNRSALSVCSALAIASAAACTSEKFNDPTGLSAGVRTSASSGSKADICHKPLGESAHIITIDMDAVGAHLAHGDYVAGYDVDRENTPGDHVHFTRISDALSEARASRRNAEERTTGACRITIAVAPGVFQGTFGTSATMEQLPLVIDVPDVTLRGSLTLQTDAAGRAGAQAIDENVVTSIAPGRPLTGTEVLVIVQDATGGYAGHGATIEGIDFRSGHPDGSSVNGGFGIFAIRVGRVGVLNNRFDTYLASAIDTRATDAAIQRNYVARMGNACGICLGGPGTYVVSDNTVTNGGRVGILLIPASTAPIPAGITQYAVGTSESVSASITNNSVTFHTRHTGGNIPGTPPVPAAGFATGVRILAAGVPDVPQQTTVTFRDNALTNNSYGLMIDGGGQNVKGDITFTAAGNTIEGNCRADLLLSFAPPNRALGVNAAAPYLTNSTFSVTLGGSVVASRRWIDHPAGYGNTLLIDGVLFGNTAPLATVPAAAACAP